MAKVTPTTRQSIKSALKVRTPRIPSQTSVNAVMESQRVDNVGAVPFPKDQMTQEGEWIRKHIRKKVCRRFVPTESAKDACDDVLAPLKVPNQKPVATQIYGDPTCRCGYKKSKHIREAMADPDRNPPWRPAVDAKSSLTDAFGEIEFMGFGQKIGKYVRVSQDTSTDTMLKLLIDKWGLEKPNLVISVTGGAKAFQMTPRLKEVFKRGLMKAAKSTGAWIITGGMHAGVMKYVGQAVKEFELSQTSKAKVTAIAIATWGCVQNRELLIDKHGKWPAEYRMEPYDNKKEPGSALDNNHSHFILVDNGTQHQFGVEINFRGQLEGAISKMKTNTGHDAISIPIVCVVLEGGPGTLETVKSAVENGTPAVIVRGSGRAADILGYAFANSRAEEIEVTDQFGKTQKRATTVMDDALIHQIMQMIKDELGVPDVVKCLDWVKQSLQKRDLITVFQLDSPESAKDIDLAILYAMLKANKDQAMDQLRLAIAWNRIDVCKEMLFTDDRRWEQKELHDVMYTVLMLDRYEFAQLFIENGVNLKDFLTLRRLLLLYNEIPKNSLLYQLLLKTNKDKSQKYFNFKVIGNLIHELMGDFYHPLYLRNDRYKKVDAELVLSNTVEKTASVTSFVALIRDDAQIDPDTGLIIIPTDFDDPSRELFIWSVLMLRNDLSEVFWGEGKDAIPAALTACNLLKGLRLKTQDTEIQKKIDMMIEHYEGLALGVLKECYQADDQKAQLLLVRELPNYGMATSLLLAVHADNKIFISHSCCQSLLNSIWRGKMTNDNGPFRVFVCVFFPVMVPALIFYREDEPKAAEVLDIELEEEAKRMKRRQLTKTNTTGLTRPSLHHMGTDSFELNDTIDGNMVLEETWSSENLQDSGIDLRDSGKKLTCWERIVTFFSAPMITFIYNCIFYIAFLLLYSVILLVTFNPTVTAEEIVLMVWVFTLFAEEVRQIAQDDASSIRLKLWSYITDIWNILDVITLLLFLTGMILRAIPDNTLTFRAARIVLAINLLTFYLRLLHIFSVFKQLGPVLVMIGRMMVDLLWFMIILMVFMVGFGVAQHAILYPNASADGILVLNVIRRSYWQMTGEIEMFLGELELSCSNAPQSQEGCSVEGIVTPIMMGMYILFTNVLMFNLLIAMFSYTFSKIQENTDLHWYFQRYFLIYEYYERPDIAPPLIFINHLYLLMKWVVLKGCGRCCKIKGRQRGFKMRFADNEEKQLILWENMNADEYLRRKQIVEKESIEHRVRETKEKVDQLFSRFDELQTDSKQSASDASSAKAVVVAGAVEQSVPLAVEKKLQFLEDHMSRTSKALDWIIAAMTENKMGAKSGPPKLPDMEREKQLAAKNSLIRRASFKEKQKEELKAKEVKKVVEHNIDLQVKLNVRSRTSPYPQSVPPVRRFELPDSKVSWKEPFPEYAPVNFTHPDVLRLKPHWADVDLLAFQNVESRPVILFNEYDNLHSVSRISFEGPYVVEDSIPKNPFGRTGLTGRGLLGRWGPNFAADPIVTRWKRDINGQPVYSEGKKVLEFVAVERKDSKQWALPGSITNKTREDQVYECLKAEFTQEAMSTYAQDKKQQASVRLKLDNLFKTGGTVVYKGYTDDPRNTDNAWLETIAVNYHDDDGQTLNPFQLRAGNSVEAVGWQMVSSSEILYGGHLALLKKVAELRDAAF
ncbi:transient receptor potential cation channel subfamily M member-like 2 isoform X2 [Lineus longissimus]|uniref:transient receptor potential cation channel subfamily M member-like 2 isoform X2 n=1 Tax=Lineus longissimus TaxID=88925 RepID=UPI00315C8F25